MDVVLFHLDMTPGDLIFVARAEKSEDKAVPTVDVTISLLQLSDFCQLLLKLSAFVNMVSYRRGGGRDWLSQLICTIPVLFWHPYPKYIFEIA